ncbi:hypothetical protein [Fodinicola acaciae]|uniref:hypothetical protein n=1 Tax=Fodinicola acaciae TaxID=2681555 RepID=UPI0013D6A86F|nr:hypothetical protein [Fodinicola acaciae]
MRVDGLSYLWLVLGLALVAIGCHGLIRRRRPPPLLPPSPVATVPVAVAYYLTGLPFAVLMFAAILKISDDIAPMPRSWSPEPAPSCSAVDSRRP